MKAGTNDLSVNYFFDAAGAGQSYANAAAFLSAGWTVTYVDMTGSVITSPTWNVSPLAGLAGRHKFQITVPNVSGVIYFTPPSGYSSAWDSAPIPVEQSSIDDIAALLTATDVSVNPITLASTANLEQYEGDSVDRTINIPTSTLSEFGWSNLVGCTLSGAIRRTTDTTTGSPLVALVATTNLTIVGADSKSVRIKQDTFPAALALSGTEIGNGGVQHYYDIQATKAGIRKTLVRGVWSIRRQEDRT